jgi:DNA-binding transcriptional LysR family regulator
MDVKDLKYFIAVYEAKGFSRACDALGTVQSNVSARIRGLEDFFGVPLFERKHRSVIPTASGERLYAHAKAVMATLETTERAVRLGAAA